MTSPADPFSSARDQELKSLLEGFQRETVQLQRLHERIAEVRGRGEAADGRVVVETTQTGALAGLTIDPRAMRLGSEELATTILEAAAEAERDAAQAASDLVAPFIEGTPLDGVRAPDEPPPPEARRR